MADCICYFYAECCANPPCNSGRKNKKAHFTKLGEKVERAFVQYVDLSLYKILVIPYKEGIDRPNLSPKVGVAADILVPDRVNLILVKELLADIRAQHSLNGGIVAIISHPLSYRNYKAELLSESYLLGKYFRSCSSESYFVLLFIYLVL